MCIEVSSQLLRADNPEVYLERLHKLQVRCVQEIRLLNKKLNEFHQQACRHTLQQRIQELQQRQKFYQAQLTSLTACASA
ncbi:hypothetical protein BKE30_05705 [Alkanindiges hydrocarboniclasticus]|jgi:hypothetical protein|uniref:Uncharacterized protein n=1 Tax=Alkanindiges hydrocarboniclasticus TaxID=1907941 RepID=A0A1S8CWQ6_9GAMM|nr:hypothetical protein [Alkanindiges hydrocarboniclasticus]ONG41272.1 hypothetical protein BKE30_05705 [Alkanindiges hydrocarboniclasticus]